MAGSNRWTQHISFISTILTGELQKQFPNYISQTQYLFVVSLINEIILSLIDYLSAVKFAELLAEFKPYFHHHTYLITAACTLTLFALRYYQTIYEWCLSLFEPNNEIKLITGDLEKVDVMIQYIGLKPEYFSKLNLGIQKVYTSAIGSRILPPLNTFMTIEDPEFHFKGRLKFFFPEPPPELQSPERKPSSLEQLMQWQTNLAASGVKTAVSTAALNPQSNQYGLIPSVLHLHLEGNGHNFFDINTYLEKIKDMVNTHRGLSVKKYYTKVTSTINSSGTPELEWNHKVISYCGDRNSLMNSFFHPKRNLLWASLNSIEHNKAIYHKFGQAPRAGFIMYGPPGTGKSSFVYRTAMSMDRSVVSLKLDDILTTTELVKVINNPIVGGTPRNYREVVFILDELDLSLKRLKDYRERLNEEITYLQNSVSQQTSFSASTSVPAPAPAPASTSPFTSKHSAPDDVEHQLQLKRKLYNSIIRDHDLLELFQGPIPMEELVVIATTNDLAYIQREIPSLVRAGRLTPVLFDFGNWEMMQEMTKFYFDGVNTDKLEQDLFIHENFTITDDIRKRFRFQQSEFIESVMQIVLAHQGGGNDQPYLAYLHYLKELLSTPLLSVATN